MKKLLIFIFICLTLGAVFGLDNQKIYSVSGSEYSDLCTLYVMAGKALPSSTGPWSKAELLSMLSGVDSSVCPALYSSLADELSSDFDLASSDIAADLGFEANLEAYGHINTSGASISDCNGVESKAFVDHSGWAYDYASSPLLYADADIYLRNYLSLYLSASLNRAFNDTDPVGTKHFSFNWPSSMDNNFPYRAYIALGTENLTFQLGRDRLSWGSGLSGNLCISDNLPFHNMARFTFFSDNFKYSYLLDFFPHKGMYYSSAGSSSSYSSSGYSLRQSDRATLSGVNMLAAHRFEGRLFDGRLALYVTEELMWASSDDHIEFLALNPSYVLHNMYNLNNSNSIIAFEADYAFLPGFNAYGQFLIDDLQISNEGTQNPNAYALLGGVKYAGSAFDGIVSACAECAYVSPYCYLRYGDDSKRGDLSSYGLDYIVAARMYSSAFDSDYMHDVFYNEYVLGYPYGPDCLVFNLSGDFKKTSLYTIGSSFTFIDHGKNDMWTVYNYPSLNYRYPSASSRDANQYTFDFSLSGSYNFDFGVTLNARADYIAIHNIYNNSNNPVQRDVQLVLGVKYSI